MTDNTNASVEPMRLRAEPPRVTRLSRKVLAGVGAAALLGIGGALIYALQTRDPGPGGDSGPQTRKRATCSFSPPAMRSRLTMTALLARKKGSPARRSSARVSVGSPWQG